MASVRKLDPSDKDSPWVVEYTDAAGKRRRKTPKSGLKKDADALRQKIEREVGDGVHVADAETLAFDKLCEEYIRHCEDKLRDGRIGQSRYQGLKTCIDKSLVPSIGRKAVKEIKVQDLDTCYRRMVTTGRLSPRTAKERIQVFKQIEDFAIGRGYLKKGVSSQAIIDLRGIEKPPVRTFSRDDIEKLFGAMQTRRFRTTERIHLMTRCVVQLAACCGLRKGEILGLTFENADFERRLLKVRHSLTNWDVLKGPKTKAGNRDVPMSPETVADLKLWLASGFIPNERGLLFRARDGKFISQSHFHNIYWRPLLNRAGLLDGGDYYHFHALRHFYASWLIANGMSVTEVADLLGHSHFDVTLQTYAHPMMGSRQRQENIDRVIGAMVAATALVPPNATETRLPELTH